MRRNAVWGVVFLSFFSVMHLAVATSGNELAQKFSKAQRLAVKGEVENAIVLYKSIILENPQRPEAYNNLAALYLQQKKIKQAKQVLEKGLLAHKGYGALYQSLTAINVAMARDAYSKALQIDLKPSDISIDAIALNKQNITVAKVAPVKAAPIKTTPIKAMPINTNTRRTINISSSTNKKQVTDAGAIEKTLQAWSAAWSAQAVDMYLSFYHNQYKPSNGLSRKGWIQSRRFRLKKPSWIIVKLSNFELKQKTNKQAVVNFKQSYKSNSFSDVSNKQILLLNTDNGWRIFREKSL